jgi:hypothetical protein
MMGVAMKSSRQRRTQRQRAFERLQAALTAEQARGAAESFPPQSQGERGQGTSQSTAQPFTRSELRDIRTGLNHGANLKAIANLLEFHPLLLQMIPNAIGGMVLDKKLLPRDRIAAAKAFAAFVNQRMEQEKRDSQLGEYDPRRVPVVPPLDGNSVQLVQNILVAVAPYAEAKKAVAARLRQVAEELRQQATQSNGQPTESQP